jgi:hypothetical protein
MRTIISRLLIALIAVSGCGLVWAVEQNPPVFLLEFDSTQAFSGDGTTVSSRVLAGFMLVPVEGQPGRYRGQGRLRYVELEGMLAVPSDGVLTISDMLVSSENGTLVLKLFPGDPKPVEWLIITPVTAIKQIQWFSGFGLMHDNELGEGGFTIDNWQYPGNDIYARKIYNRNKTEGTALLTETTTIELSPIPDVPRIDEINIVSDGLFPDDPETGEDLELSADLYVPFLFEIERCTWTGNNFTGSGVGDPEDSCRWTYKPKEGKGPRRDTYGQKNLNLRVVYRYGVQSSALALSKSVEHKVFFSKKGDDDSDSEPNWFDYWGDDGAVPGLDASNVKYNAALAAGTIAEADGTNVTFGPDGAGFEGAITIPPTEDCDGRTFPGGEGIDLTALSLSHERKHNELDALAGTDGDGDEVPDSAESGTSPTNPDSCNLAGEIDAEYASYGDNEFIARLAELGVSGLASNDWAIPGRQTSSSPALLGTFISATSGVVHAPQLSLATHSSQRTMQQSASLVGNGLLTGVYNVVGQNPDTSGLFASMRLDVGLNIIDTDHYTVIAWLANDLGTELAWARAEADLGPGGSTVQLLFDGPVLQQAGIAQPFVVSRVELYYRVGKHSELTDSAQNVQTGVLDSSDFRPPAASLVGSLSALPVDSDFDGLYNQLEVTVDLDIYKAGEYEVSAQLNGTTLTLFGSQRIVIADGVSSAQVSLGFDGSSIFFNREDGPFDVTGLQVKDALSGARLDFQANALTTAAYPFVAFQHSAVVIDENSYSDAGGELDGDGKFLTLDLMFAVNSKASGPYTISASLEDNQGGTIATTGAVIGLGGFEGEMEISQVMLSFDARDIFAAGVDGPYQVADVMVISDAGIVMDQNPIPWLTAAYPANDFGLVPVTEEIFLDGFE